MVELADAPSVAPDVDDFGGILRSGETPEQALRRLEKTKSYAKTIGSDEGQRLLAAAHSQAKNGSPSRAKAEHEVAVLRARGMDLEAHELEVAIGPAPEMRGPFLVDVPLELVDIGENVRVDPGELAELAASITELGVLQPIRVIGPSHDGRYRAVWGQRRVMASIIAKKATIPALVELEAEANVPGARRSIEQLAENLQRKDLNPIEEAVALRAVLEATKGLTQEQLATKLGRSGAWLSNTLRLLETAPEVQDLVRTDKLTTAHAKAIAGLDVDLQAEFADRAIKGHWSSSETERQTKWTKDQANEIRKRRATGERRAAEAIALLEKVAQPKTATIGVSDYAGSGETTKAIKKAGWKTVDGYDVEAIDEAGSCGCKGVWRVEVPWNAKDKVKLSPACGSKEHREARRTVQQAEWDRRRQSEVTDRKAAEEAAERRRAGLAELLVGIGSSDPFTLRLAIYGLVDDSSFVDENRDTIPGLIEADGDDRDDAWTLLEALPADQLPLHLARAIAGALDDQWRVGDKVRLAIDARLPKPPGVPAAKPAKGKKAAAS